MFNTIRSYPAPESLNRYEYNTREVVQLLERIFFGKCYLCEHDELMSPEIEHFDPHEGDEQKKFDWNNLYYSCSRCNSIKSNKHTNLLDCCDENIDVFRAIKCLLPSTPDGSIIVKATKGQPNQKTINTVQLIDKCYNEDNTALRGITRSAMVEKLFEHFTEFLSYRLTIKSKKSTAPEKEYAKLRIISMAKVEFPFSVFWRWHILDDAFLRHELEHLIDF